LIEKAEDGLVVVGFVMELRMKLIVPVKVDGKHSEIFNLDDKTSHLDPD
jgi:hypothetical protein